MQIVNIRFINNRVMFILNYGFSQVKNGALIEFPIHFHKIVDIISCYKQNLNDFSIAAAIVYKGEVILFGSNVHFQIHVHIFDIAINFLRPFFCSYQC